LSKEILFGKLKDGGRVVVDLVDNELVAETYALVVQPVVI
jgi:hypothetical protein